MIDDPEVIQQLLGKGMPPATVAMALDIPLELVQEYATARTTRTTDAEELTTAMNQFAWRAFDEGMRLLDEGTPAIKVRLISGAMGHTLRLLNAQSPKELEETRAELSSLLHAVSTDDTQDSIYADFPDPDDAIYYDPSAVEIDTFSPEVNDPDEIPKDRAD